MPTVFQDLSTKKCSHRPFCIIGSPAVRTDQRGGAYTGKDQLLPFLPIRVRILARIAVVVFLVLPPLLITCLGQVEGVKVRYQDTGYLEAP